jgi:uncharacterized membrane protein YjgN (DUF898 family)
MRPMDMFYVLRICILMVARILQNAGNERKMMKVITVLLILSVPFIVTKMRCYVEKATIREGVKVNAFAGHEEQIVMAIYVMAGVPPCAKVEKFWFQEAKMKEDAKDVQHANQTPVHPTDPR